METNATRAVKLVWLAVDGILAILLPPAYAVFFFGMTYETYGPNATVATLISLAMVLFFTAKWWRTRVRNTLTSFSQTKEK